MIITDAMVEAAARSDAAFDGRDFDALGRSDKRRYLDRSRKALEAATIGSWFDDLRLALSEAAEQLQRVHDDAFSQAAGYGLVTSDGRDFSCFQLNMCQTEAGKAKRVIAALDECCP